MNSTNDAHELQEENLRGEQGRRKDTAPDGVPIIHTSTVHSDQQSRESISFKLQKSWYAGLGLSEATQRVAR